MNKKWRKKKKILNIGYDFSKREQGTYVKSN